MANDLNFTQISTMLNDIHRQVTGNQNAVAPIDTSQFVNVATTTLMQGYDVVLNAISQMIGRTIFSVRPYTRKFKSLERTHQEYGNHVRKLQALDLDWEDDQQWTLKDGESVDMYKVRKPKILQTNFYGSVVRQRHYTIFRKQLDNAFSGPGEFSRFMQMVTQNNSDVIEQSHENLARYTVANLMGGIIDSASANQVIHLITEYNADKSPTTPWTLQTLKQSREAWVDFNQWSFARMQTISEMLTERTYLFHLNLEDTQQNPINIPRHTPHRDQRAYFNSGWLNQIAYTVRTNILQERFMRLLDHERVSFWQNITDPMSINVKPSYTGKQGQVVVATDAVEEGNIFGILYDREAMGMTTVDQYVSTTPFNSAGGYWNVYFHYTDKWYNDSTENSVLFLLD